MRSGQLFNVKKEILFSIFLISVCFGTGWAKSGKRPNILVLVADQLRYQSVGYSGDKKAITPNIDQLAKEGMNFKNFVANTPVCSAFRASLLTGKYASSTGVVVNELRLNPNQDTLPHVLNAAGYKSELIGKWHLWANKAGGHGRVENAYTPPGPHRLGFDSFWAGYNFGHSNFHARYYRDTPEVIRIKGFGTTHFVNLAIDRLKEHQKNESPFFMMMAFSPPHDPFSLGNAPKKWAEKFKDTKFPLPKTFKERPDPKMDRNADPKKWKKHWKPNLERMMRGYYAMTSALDEEIGRVMKALKDLGLEEDTIVIFTSDHGEMFGAQGRIFKMIFYEESARVPFLIRWPKNIKAGSVSDACMSTVDIMPTLLGLCGLDSPRQVEGMNLAPITKGEKGFEPEFALLQGMGHTYLWKDGYEWRALRSKQYTYARYLVDGEELLFDNLNDPEQSIDLAKNPKHEKLLKTLREKMNAKMKELNDEFKPCSWYRDNWTKNREIVRAAKGPFKREMVSASQKVE